ncbi:hypothetical protein [Mycolicibacterium hassiacum]|uniref:hypothetical protein n=1 Tax=Mycolicibacterium hassiacum TaxID=46351 RepID=UPI000F4B1364|nr:hypothetical protein [Mycolicibacterium hassiacum]
MTAEDMREHFRTNDVGTPGRRTHRMCPDYGRGQPILPGTEPDIRAGSPAPGEQERGSACDDRGVLPAAMVSDDVAHALDLLPERTDPVQVASGHPVHFDRPDAYLEAFRRLDAHTPQPVSRSGSGAAPRSRR